MYARSRKPMLYAKDVNDVRGLLGDNEEIAIGAELHLCGPVMAALKLRVEPASGASFPSWAKPNPVMLLGTPAFSTYTTLPCTVTLTGSVPPEGTRSASLRPFWSTSKTDRSLLP